MECYSTFFISRPLLDGRMNPMKGGEKLTDARLIRPATMEVFAEDIGPAVDVLIYEGDD